MGKSKKIVLKRIGMISLILLSLYIIGTILFVSFFPRIYLANKYDTKMSDYKVCDYYPGHFAYDINYWDVVWHDSHLVYEAKDDGRIFKVKFINFQYYDAYQMKEVSQWITEELQNNVDKNIDMVNVSDATVYGIYDKEKDEYKNVVWTKDNVSEIIKAGRISDVFIKTNNIKQYLNETRNENKYTDSLYYYDMNDEFKEYMIKLDVILIKKYNNDSFHINFHQNELPECNAYYGFYGVDLNKLGKYEGSFVNVNLEDYVWLPKRELLRYCCLF